MSADIHLWADEIQSAVESKKLSEAAARNMLTWLERPLSNQDSTLIGEHIRNSQWAELESAFWTIIPFGTAGRRGRMYPIGSAAINDRTIGETIQALGDHVSEISGDSAKRCAIAYDCRHRSREFAELSAEIMLAAGFTIYFLDGIRSTPELATTVRHFGCQCGIMITASHNPPTDNAVKVFWSNGGQMKSPHDKDVTARMDALTKIERTPFADGIDSGKVILCQEEMDTVYRQAVLATSFEGPRALKIVYSPLHGVGLTSVKPVLELDGFSDVETYGAHATPDGDFPNVPNNIANPENAAVFDSIAKHAANIGADLALASDPDADRIGCSAPRRLNDSQWRTLNGNQIGALIGDYILRRRSDSLTADHFVVKTIVSSDMLLAIAESYGIHGAGEVLTGFKWIGSKMDELGAEKFLFGFEEAHGYLVGDFIRDKDAAGAAMMLAQRAAEAKSQGRTLHEDLDLLYRKHGLFDEMTVAKKMPGADGMQRMRQIMHQLRESPPATLAGMQVTRLRDYRLGIDRFADGSTKSCNVPKGNVLVFGLSERGYRAAVRPSGTEPKIKFYLFGHLAAEQIQNLDDAKDQVREQLHRMHDDFMKAVGLSMEIA